VFKFSQHILITVCYQFYTNSQHLVSTKCFFDFIKKAYRNRSVYKMKLNVECSVINNIINIVFKNKIDRQPNIHASFANLYRLF
jgi:hypothetical protein